MPSEDLVARSREITDAWNRGDIDAFVARLHPEFEWHTSADFPGLDSVYRGADGWRKFDRDFRESWESLTVPIDELRQSGDRVVSLATFHARGRDGIDLRRPIAWVTTFRDGLAVRGEVYGTWDAAIEAVGRGATR